MVVWAETTCTELQGSPHAHLNGGMQALGRYPSHYLHIDQSLLTKVPCKAQLQFRSLMFWSHFSVQLIWIKPSDDNSWWLWGGETTSRLGEQSCWPQLASQRRQCQLHHNDSCTKKSMASPGRRCVGSAHFLVQPIGMIGLSWPPCEAKAQPG